MTEKIENWKSEKFGNIFKTSKGKKSKESSQNWQKGFLPYLSTEYLRRNKMTEFAKISNDIVLVEDEDLILLWDGSNAGEFFSGKKGILSSTMVKLQLKDENKSSKRFLFYFLKTKEEYLRGQTKGTGIPHVESSILNNFIIPFPPLIEQQKIAEILSTVDEAIQKVDSTIERTKRLKQGLMDELLTKGIGHKEFKDSEIGRIPKEWRVIKLDDLSLNLIGGGTPSTSNPAFWDGTIPWMTSAYINRRLVTKGQRNITEEGLKNSATNLIPKENLLITTRVGIGKVAINVIDMAISQDLTGIIVDKTKSTPDFLYWFFISIENKLKGLAQGSTIKGILREELGRLKVTLPSLSEQQKIAEILTTVDLKIEIEEKRRERLERIKKGLMEELLTGKKRVSVG